MRSTLPMHAPVVDKPDKPDKSDKSEQYLVCFGILCLIVLALGMIAFFITGIIFTVQEFNDIPSCAAPYKAWMITLLIMMGSGGSKANSANDTAEKDMGIKFIVTGIVTGLIAGLGWTMVLHHPKDTCDTSAISDIIVWTEWFVYYCVVLTAIQLPAGAVYCCQQKWK